MCRPLRLHAPGLFHHVFARGNDKACIFEDDRDYELFLELLDSTLSRFRVDCVAYCLLWNHYHLLLIPQEHPVSRLLQQLNSSYCQQFNRRHGRVGHVLQGRFGCRIVEDGAYARSVLRYLALNPVAAGQVGKPEDWRWSSYRYVVGPAVAPDFLQLAHAWAAFGTSHAALGAARFSDFVLAGLQDTFINPLLHGSPTLAHRMVGALEPHHSTSEFVYSHRFAARPPLGSVLEHCGDHQALETALHVAFYKHAYTLGDLSAAVGKHPSTVWRWIQRAAKRTPVPQTETSAEEDNPAKIKT